MSAQPGVFDPNSSGSIKSFQTEEDAEVQAFTSGLGTQVSVDICVVIGYTGQCRHLCSYLPYWLGKSAYFVA